MEWLLFLAAGSAGAAVAWRKVSAARETRRQRAADVASVRRLAEEDTTAFGEQLQRLGEEVEDRQLEPAAVQDYQQALDAYERAKWDAPRLDAPEKISTLVDTLATGRYAMACVRARVAGEELPELRIPCFFNPQHGPSWTDIEWRLPHRGTRMLPACRQCAARVTAKEQPEVRKVRIGSRAVPYWEAGATYYPYTQGNFADKAWGGAGVAWLWQVNIDRAGGLGSAGAGAGGYEVGGGGGMDWGDGGGD